MKNFLNNLPIAHRGLHDKIFPENSLPAFRAAAEHGYAIETDVRFTKDRRIAVFHDDDLLRMTGDKRTVFECTMSELKTLSLAKTPDRIPEFCELLECVNRCVPLLIEIKNMAGVSGKEIAVALSEALKDYGGEYAVQSFNPFYVRAYKKLHPEIACGVLSAKMDKNTFEGKLSDGVKAYLLSNLKLNFLVKPDFVSYSGRDLPKKAFDRFRGTKLCWIISSYADEQIVRPFCDNIIFEGYLPDKP